MTAIWHNLSIRTRRLLIVMSILTGAVLIGMQFHVSSQGDGSETYPKGFRGGTCTIESDALSIGYSAYFIPHDYEIPEDALSAMSVPILCDMMPGPGLLSIAIDLLHPESVREQPIALSLLREIDGESSRVLLSIPAQTYQSGNIYQDIRIGEPGEYIIRLDGIDEYRADFTLEIPITVGAKWYEPFVQFWPLLLLSAVAVLLYNLKRIID